MGRQARRDAARPSTARARPHRRHAEPRRDRHGTTREGARRRHARVSLMRSLLVLCLVAGTAVAGTSGFDPKVVYKVPLGDAPVVGPADAPVTIVAWSDYACGYCNRVQPTLDRLEQMYPGQIRWVHRTLPLDEDYTLAAEASLAAAAQGKFKPMHGRLFALHGRVTRAEAELVAREIGLDMIRFRGELDAGTYRKVIAADMTDAEKLG